MNSQTSLNKKASQDCQNFYRNVAQTTLDTLEVLEEKSSRSKNSLNEHCHCKNSRNEEDSERILTKKEIKKIAKNPKHRLIQRQVIYVIGIIPEIANQKVSYFPFEIFPFEIFSFEN